MVSIHAPARGATWGSKLHQSTLIGFNPRAREGRDFGQLVYLPGVMLFQSTRPRGARRTDTQAAKRDTSFNPRAREGRD